MFVGLYSLGGAPGRFLLVLRRLRKRTFLTIVSTTLVSNVFECFIDSAFVAQWEFWRKVLRRLRGRDGLLLDFLLHR